MKRQTSVNSVLERLAALGDMTRLRVLRLLEAEALSVGELAKVLQMPQSTVSRHLKVLADADWVTKRNEGPATFYRVIQDDLGPDARSLWATVRDQLSGAPDLAEDQRRLKGVLAERRTDSLSFFGRVSGEWDHLRNELFGVRFTPLAMLSLLPRTWTVADIGCGTGNAAEVLAPVVSEVLAVDLSEPMLDAARGRLTDATNVRFIRAAIDHIPLPDRSVDAAVCVLVLHHLAAPEAALAEARRLLRGDRGGGVMLVIDMVEHDRDEYRHTMGHQHAGFSQARMKDIMTRAGLTDFNYRELPSEPEAKGPGLFVATGRIPD